MKKLSIISLLIMICCNSAHAAAEFRCADNSKPVQGSGYDSICEGQWVFYASFNSNIRCDTDSDCFDGGDKKYDYDEMDVVCYKGTYGHVSDRETYGICAHKYRQTCTGNYFNGSYYATSLENAILDNTCLACPDNATCDGQDVKCDDGYYLTNTDTPYNPICAACPQVPGLEVRSYADGSGPQSIEHCYAAGGTDDSGTFEYVEQCYYQE